MSKKIYVNPETAIVFADSAQGPDENITLANLASDAGRVSVQHDFGSGARSDRFQWQAVLQFATAPVVGETVDLYLATAQETAATVHGRLVGGIRMPEAPDYKITCTEPGGALMATPHRIEPQPPSCRHLAEWLHPHGAHEEVR